MYQYFRGLNKFPEGPLSFLLSTLDIILDKLVSVGFLNGQYYTRIFMIEQPDLNCTHLGTKCKTDGCIKVHYSCFEKDPIWGVVDLAFFLLPGFFTWITKTLNKAQEARLRGNWIFFFSYLLFCFPFLIAT